MKEQVRDMFETIRMPEETEVKIRQMMNHSHNQKRRVTWKRAAALASVLVLMLSLSPAVQAAVNNWVVKYFWPDSDITIFERTDGNGNTVGICGVDTEAPPFARVVNGRLYFVGNGEKIDITEQIKEDAPYYYTYVDEYNLTHYMAVAFSGSIDNFGIYEFIRNEESGEWVTGTGRNFIDPETEGRYSWVELVWEHWNIPWPMPE